MSVFTQADLDRIDAVIARGEKTVQFADRSTTYRSLEELLQARALIAAEVNAGPRTRYGTGEKGL